MHFPCAAARRGCARLRTPTSSTRRTPRRTPAASRPPPQCPDPRGYRTEAMKDCGGGFQTAAPMSGPKRLQNRSDERLRRRLPDRRPTYASLASRTAPPQGARLATARLGSARLALAAGDSERRGRQTRSLRRSGGVACAPPRVTSLVGDARKPQARPARRRTRTSRVGHQPR